MTFSEETPADVGAIHQLTFDAFGRGDEAELVASLRENGGLAFSALARHDNETVAHLACSPVTIGGKSSDPAFLALAPVSVGTAHQRKGYGTALIQWSLKVLSSRGFPGVLVLGEPEFYRRAGFVPAADWGIICPFDVPPRFFLAIETGSDGLAKSRGVVSYRQEFAALT